MLLVLFIKYHFNYWLGKESLIYQNQCNTHSLWLTVPSQPVGLEANYINSSALRVTWQLPLFPNGNITKFIVKYESSRYSPWKQDFDWCSRQVFGNRPGGDTSADEGSADKNPDGRYEFKEIKFDLSSKTIK